MQATRNTYDFTSHIAVYAMQRGDGSRADRTQVSVHATK
jgi:hypothetical protein